MRKRSTKDRLVHELKGRIRRGNEGEKTPGVHASPPPLPRRGNTYKTLVGKSMRNTRKSFSTSNTEENQRTMKVDPDNTTDIHFDPPSSKKPPPPLPPRSSSSSPTAMRKESRRPKIPEIPTVYVNVMKILRLNSDEIPGSRYIRNLRSRKWKVTVPNGSSGGRPLRVALTQGRDVRVKIPDDLRPGDTFHIRHSDKGQEYTKKTPNKNMVRESSQRLVALVKHVSGEANERYRAVRNTKIGVCTWCLSGYAPTEKQLQCIVNDLPSESDVYAICFQMCAHVVSIDKMLRRLMTRKYSATCNCVGPDANGLYNVVFVFISSDAASRLRATLSSRTARRGDAFVYKTARSSIDDSVNMWPSAVSVRLRLTCTRKNEAIKVYGRLGSFIDLRFVTFYLPKDSRLRCRLKMRNRIATDLLEQLRDDAESMNQIEICAGAFNYRLLLSPEKVFRTIVQATSAERAKSKETGSFLRTKSSKQYHGGREFWEYMYPFDEMFQEMTKKSSSIRRTLHDKKNGGLECADASPFWLYKESPPAYPPSYPRIPHDRSDSPRKAMNTKAVEKFYCVDVLDQSTPSWSDRIIWRCKLNDALRFHSCDDYRALDIVGRGGHCPVAISFLIQ